MDEKLNNLLIIEINKGIESLKKDEEQLQKEFDEYGYKNNGIINKQIQGDLKKVQEEIKIKEQELSEVEETNKLLEKYKIENKELKEKYNKLAKEQKDCIDAIKALEGRYDNINGKLVPTKEQQEYERDLEKINLSMSEIKSTVLNSKREILVKEAKLTELYDKYDIARKIKEQEEKEEKKEDKDSNLKEDNDKKEESKVKTNEETIVKSNNEEQSAQTDKNEDNINSVFTVGQQQKDDEKHVMEPKVKETVRVGKGTKHDIYELEKLGNTDKFDKINEIYCRIVNGKVQYSFEGEGKEDKIKYFIETVKPRRISKKEKAYLKEHFNNKDLKNIDIEIVRILNSRDKEYGTELLKQYFYNIENKKIYPENCDLNIEYNLNNLKTAKINNKAKKLLKRTAKLGEKSGLATYIKPVGKITEILSKFKQKLITSGNLEDTKELPSREKLIKETYKNLYNEEGFEFEEFCKTMNLSQEEKESLQVYNESYKNKKNFYRSTVLTQREKNIYSEYNKEKNNKNFDFEKFSEKMNLSEKEKIGLKGYEDINKTNENLKISGNNNKTEEIEK